MYLMLLNSNSYISYLRDYTNLNALQQIIWLSSVHFMQCTFSLYTQKNYQTCSTQEQRTG